MIFIIKWFFSFLFLQIKIVDFFILEQILMGENKVVTYYE